MDSAEDENECENRHLRWKLTREIDIGNDINGSGWEMWEQPKRPNTISDYIFHHFLQQLAKHRIFGSILHERICKMPSVGDASIIWFYRTSHNKTISNSIKKLGSNWANSARKYSSSFIERWRNLVDKIKLMKDTEGVQCVVFVNNFKFHSQSSWTFALFEYHQLIFILWYQSLNSQLIEWTALLMVQNDLNIANVLFLSNYFHIGATGQPW